MKRTFVSLLLLVASLSTSWAQVSSLAADPNLSETARSVGYGETLFVDGMQLSDVNQSLRLRRFQVWADDARIIVHGETGDVQFPVPKNAYFTGTIEGANHSRAFMTVLEDGRVRGVINQDGRYWLFERNDADGMQVNELDDTQKEERSFECGTDNLPAPPLPKSGAPHHAVTETKALGGSGNYNVRVAVETDFEFYQKFGNATDATDYIGDILGYGSGIYGDEADANLVIGDVSLWSAIGDPWTASDSNCGLFEFGGYWNQNNSGIARTIAHFFSGKSPNNGLAWVGVLCQNAFNFTTACMSPNTGNYGGAYGFTSGLDANFNINSPSVVWDIVAVTHEIGHNFNSPHTHCYAGLEGNASPIDMCYGSQSGANCYAGPATLPCGTASAGCGTLMSYCHLLGGGLANISLTFGQGHPHGVAPGRAPIRMNAHVVSQATSFPSCITTAACTAPSISATTGNQTKCAGSSVTFSVTASNATGYQWRKNNVDIGGATSSSYTIDPISAGDAGSYTCRVSNACDNVTSTAATLTVNPVTTISSQSSAMDRCVGTSATFSVTATGTGTLTYQWRKAGNDIGGATSSSYIINSVVQGDAGSYDCVVTSSCGTATSTAIALTVRTPLSISQQPGDLTKCVGQSATFTTAVTGGFSTISYQWYKGVTPVGTNSASLIIPSVVTGDAGNYSCTITDGCGSITTETHSLTVQSSPTLNSGPSATSRCVGDSVTFQVNVTGSGLGYQWQKNSSNIGGATSSSYTIASIVLGDDADYRCVITSNCGGLNTSQAHLTVTNGSFGMVAEPSSLIQGLALITLDAQVTCGGGSLTTTWTNLNTGQSYGTNVNPVTLPSYLEETTVFRAVANNGNTQISEQVIVLAAEHPDFLDLNGDGCNDIEDLLFILADWLDAGGLDANGDGILNALDFLTINIEGPCP